MEESDIDHNLKTELKKLSGQVNKVNEQIQKRILLKKLKEKHLDKALRSIAEIIEIQDKEDNPIIINKKTLQKLTMQDKLEIWITSINELDRITRT